MKTQQNPRQDWTKIFEKELADEMGKAPIVSEVHGKDHIFRVLMRCIRLGEKLGADLDVLVAAAYLHDLGRYYIQDEAHGGLSAVKAEPVLERIGFPREKQAHVLHAIRVHDITADPGDRTSLESKILYDADKLDTFGVVGILRYIRRFYPRTTLDVILSDMDSRWRGLALSETRDLAQKDYAYARDYFLQLKTALLGTGGDS